MNRTTASVRKGYYIEPADLSKSLFVLYLVGQADLVLPDMAFTFAGYTTLSSPPFFNQHPFCPFFSGRLSKIKNEFNRMSKRSLLFNISLSSPNTVL